MSNNKTSIARLEMILFMIFFMNGFLHDLFQLFYKVSLRQFYEIVENFQKI